MAEPAGAGALSEPVRGAGPEATPAQIDAALMARVRSGDRAAFERLVDRHRDGLVAYLARMAGDPSLAQDLAQEAFLRLYRAADRYRERGHLQAYLYRIASNLLRSRVRGERRFTWIPFESARHGARETVTPQDATLQDEATRRVSEAIRELPWAFRAPLVLHAVEGWPIARIAAMLGCREGTVKSRISRARRNLRTRLASRFDRPGGAP